MKMIQEIGEPDNAAAYLKSKRKTRRSITGFSHRVCRTEDPRAQDTRDGLQKLSEEIGKPECYQILQAVVEAMKPYALHGLNVNVDFYSGAIYQLHCIKTDLYVSIFDAGRMPGWIIQCI